MARRRAGRPGCGASRAGRPSMHGLDGVTASGSRHRSFLRAAQSGPSTRRDHDGGANRRTVWSCAAGQPGDPDCGMPFAVRPAGHSVGDRQRAPPDGPKQGRRFSGHRTGCRPWAGRRVAPAQLSLVGPSRRRATPRASATRRRSRRRGRQPPTTDPRAGPARGQTLAVRPGPTFSPRYAGHQHHPVAPRTNSATAVSRSSGNFGGRPACTSVDGDPPAGGADSLTPAEGGVSGRNRPVQVE